MIIKSNIKYIYKDKFLSPSNTFSILSLVGCGLLRSSVYMDMTIPGIQKPH